MIMLWHGAAAAIPPNWALCNGQTVAGVATPDLRDRFVAGAGGVYAPGDTGGSAQVTLTADQMPAHNHTITTGVAFNRGMCSENGSPTAIPWWTPCPLRNRTLPPSSTAGASKPHENRPPYYALAYIMRVS